MGKKLDALLGRKFRPSKLRPLANLALSRLAVLKSQRQSRSSLAQSDVVHLLGLGQHERALLRVEQVIKEQNMLDVLAMIESYCSVVIERIDLIQEKECPEELKEAISSLIFASSRTGEFPELQEMRAVLTSYFGREFAARSIELRNNCGVNIKMIQKLSTRQPNLEIRMMALQEIAAENGIDLNLKDAEKNVAPVKLEQQSSENVHEEFSESVGDPKRKYKDVADAAQHAFQSAANAAAAAKAAVELSRYRPPDTDDNDNRDLQRKEDMKDKEINDLSLKKHEMNVNDVKETLEDDAISSTTEEDVEGRESPLPHQEDLSHLTDNEESKLKNPINHSAKGLRKQKVQGLDDKKGRISVRTRR